MDMIDPLKFVAGIILASVATTISVIKFYDTKIQKLDEKMERKYDKINDLLIKFLSENKEK